MASFSSRTHVLIYTANYLKTGRTHICFCSYVWGLKFLALFQKMCYIEYTDRDSHRSGYSQQLKYNLHHAVTIAVVAAIFYP